MLVEVLLFFWLFLPSLAAGSSLTGENFENELTASYKGLGLKKMPLDALETFLKPFDLDDPQLEKAVLSKVKFLWEPILADKNCRQFIFPTQGTTKHSSTSTTLTVAISNLLGLPVVAKQSVIPASASAIVNAEVQWMQALALLFREISSSSDRSNANLDITFFIRYNLEEFVRRLRLHRENQTLTDVWKLLYFKNSQSMTQQSAASTLTPIPDKLAQAAALLHSTLLNAPEEFAKYRAFLGDALDSWVLGTSQTRRASAIRLVTLAELPFVFRDAQERLSLQTSISSQEPLALVERLLTETRGFFAYIDLVQKLATTPAPAAPAQAALYGSAAQPPPASIDEPAIDVASATGEIFWATEAFRRDVLCAQKLPSGGTLHQFLEKTLLVRLAGDAPETFATRRVAVLRAMVEGVPSPGAAPTVSVRIGNAKAEEDVDDVDLCRELLERKEGVQLNVQNGVSQVEQELREDEWVPFVRGGATSDVGKMLSLLQQRVAAEVNGLEQEGYGNAIYQTVTQKESKYPKFAAKKKFEQFDKHTDEPISEEIDKRMAVLIMAIPKQSERLPFTEAWQLLRWLRRRQASPVTAAAAKAAQMPTTAGSSAQKQTHIPAPPQDQQKKTGEQLVLYVRIRLAGVKLREAEFVKSAIRGLRAVAQRLNPPATAGASPWPADLADLLRKLSTVGRTMEKFRYFDKYRGLVRDEILRLADLVFGRLGEYKKFNEVRTAVKTLRSFFATPQLAEPSTRDKNRSRSGDALKLPTFEVAKKWGFVAMGVKEAERAQLRNSGSERTGEKLSFENLLTYLPVSANGVSGHGVAVPELKQWLQYIHAVLREARTQLAAGDREKAKTVVQELRETDFSGTEFPARVAEFLDVLRDTFWAVLEEVTEMDANADIAALTTVRKIRRVPTQTSVMKRFVDRAAREETARREKQNQPRK